jgi:hypothetical protein
VQACELTDTSAAVGPTRRERHAIERVDHDGSRRASWGAETRLGTTGSFDILTAPATTSGAGFLGGYDGLTSSGSTFGAAFVMAESIATNGPTDLFFNTVPEISTSQLC